MSQGRKSVQRKLTELILGTSFLVLALTLIGLLIYEVRTYRHATARSLSTLSGIIAENSAAVLLFDDEKLAAEILASLRVDSEVAAAALYSKEGQLYATYPFALSASAFPSSPEPDGMRLGFQELTIWKPVSQGTTRAGTLYIKGDLRGTYQRLGVYGWALLFIALGAVGISFPLSHYLQRRVSLPLAELATAARKVSSERNYRIRAVKTSDDEIGDLTDALNSMLDEIHRSNAALQEEEDRLRTLADNMAQLAWIIDAKGNLLWRNKRWYDYTGLSANLPQQAGRDLVHPDFREPVMARFQKQLMAGEPWEDTFPLKGRDGEYRWFLSRAAPIRDAQGQVLRYFGTNTDITELRDVEQKLMRARDEAVAASAAKDEFLAKLSHELRTPLNPVLLLVSDEERNRTLPADLQSDFEIIKNNVELEARLIDDLLDLTAIVKGKLVLHRRIVSLNEVIHDATQKVIADATGRGISLRSHLDPQNPHIHGDPVRLQQVFWNILKNAVKFSRSGGSIMISTVIADSRNRVHVTITDDGMGMSPQELAKIFDSFAQGDHAAGGGSHRFGGLGLGLAIAQRVVELHEGSIAATSAGRDKGSTFVVDLPISIPKPSAHAPAALPHDPQIPDGSGLTILLVEDHEPTSVSLDRLLQRRHFTVVRAASLNEARATFLTRRFDFLISDIGLPDGSGHALMPEFLGRAPHLVGIALTGYGMDSDMELSRRAGFAVHLTKPVRTESLNQALLSAIQILQVGSKTTAGT